MVTKRTVQTIIDAWKTAQNETLGSGLDAFYKRFQELSGISSVRVKDYWLEWQGLTHKQAVWTAEQCKVNVRKAGFQAFIFLKEKG